MAFLVLRVCSFSSPRWIMQSQSRRSSRRPSREMAGVSCWLITTWNQYVRPSLVAIEAVSIWMSSCCDIGPRCLRIYDL